MAKAVLGWLNRALTATLAATSEQAALPVENLINDHLAVKWRAQGAANQDIDLDFGSPLSIGAVGLFGTNLTAAATWRITMSTASQSGTDIHDSGTIPAAVVAGYGQAVHVLVADTSARYLRIRLDDAGNPDGYVEAGLLFAGPLFRPQRNFSYGRAHGLVDPSVRSKSKGGQLYVDLRDKYRVQEFELRGLTEAEVHSDALEMDRILGVSGNLLFVPDYESAFKNYDAIFGPISDATPPVHTRKPVFAKRYRIEERL